MALKALLNSLDGISDDVKKLYRQDGNVYVLDVEPAEGFELSDVKSLKKALETERGSFKEASKRLKAFEGLDPEQARTALSQIDEFKKADPEKRAEQMAQAQIKDWQNKFKAEQETLLGRSKKLESKLSKVLVENAAIEAVSKEKGSTTLLLPHIVSHVRMRETENGDFIAEVTDSSGNPRVGDTSGNPMTIPQFVAELKASSDFARAFDGPGSSGSGAGTTGTRGLPQNRQANKQPTVIQGSGGGGVLTVSSESLAKGEATFG